MPSINCETAREELYKCLEQTEAVKKVRFGLVALKFNIRNPLTG